MTSPAAALVTSPAAAIQGQRFSCRHLGCLLARAAVAKLSRVQAGLRRCRLPASCLPRTPAEAPRAVLEPRPASATAESVAGPQQASSTRELAGTTSSTSSDTSLIIQLGLARRFFCFSFRAYPILLPPVYFVAYYRFANPVKYLGKNLHRKYST